jgi:hypothetical protein
MARFDAQIKGQRVDAATLDVSLGKQHVSRLSVEARRMVLTGAIASGTEPTLLAPDQRSAKRAESWVNLALAGRCPPHGHHAPKSWGKRIDVVRLVESH